MRSTRACVYSPSHDSRLEFLPVMTNPATITRNVRMAATHQYPQERGGIEMTISSEDSLNE